METEQDKERVLKVTRAAEKFWLIAFIAITLVTAWLTYSEGWASNKTTPVIPLLAGVWYVIRRIFRKRLERDLGK